MENYFHTQPPTESLIIDGKKIEDHIIGYRTLSASGRELHGVRLETAGTILGRAGTIITGESLDPRIIKVNYILQAETPEEFRNKYNALNLLLRPSNKNATLQFEDEPTKVFYGRLADAEIPEPGKLTVISSFDLICEDPYKYDLTPATFTGNPTTIYSDLEYENIPELIDVTLNEAATNVEIYNMDTGRKIVLNGNYEAGAVIQIRIADKEMHRRLTVNGQNRMQDLDYIQTSWMNFTVHQGDRISVTPASTVSVTIRKRWL